MPARKAPTRPPSPKPSAPRDTRAPSTSDEFTQLAAIDPSLLAQRPELGTMMADLAELSLARILDAAENGTTEEQLEVAKKFAPLLFARKDRLEQEFDLEAGKEELRGWLTAVGMKFFADGPERIEPT